MGLFDDFLSRTKQAAESVGSNVGDYIVSTITDPFVEQGEEPTGNLTADQVQRGVTGSAPGTYNPPPRAPAPALAPAQAGFNLTQAVEKYKFALIGVGALFVLMAFKKRR